MIKIKNAHENNLKHIDLDLPLKKIICITGGSGSGKSSLIYDVIAAQSKRIEKIDSGNASLATFTIKPEVDSIENLPYCEIVKQQDIKESISSSIATISGIHELLRDEFVKQGEIIGKNGNIIKKPTSLEIANFIKIYRKNIESKLYAILCYGKMGYIKNEIALLKKHKIKEVFYFTDKKKIAPRNITYLEKLDYDIHNILIEINNIEDIEKYDDIALDGFLFKSANEEIDFCRDFVDLNDGKLYQVPSHQLLSFNSTSKDSGKCVHCNGYGIIENIYDKALFTNRSLDNIDCVNLTFDTKGKYYKYIFLSHDDVVHECKKANIGINKSYFELTRKEQDFVKKIFFERMIKHKNKDSISIFWHTEICPICNGTRLNYKANAVRLFGKNISEILSLTIDEAIVFLRDKTLHHKKIRDILESLSIATLGYLTLDRTLTTLSGGESQRLKLSLILHSKYNNLLYILDEPSSGLHPYNNMQIFNIISQIARQKNTILISEHNEFYKKHSNLLIELGKGSGINGGEIVYCGKYNKHVGSFNVKYREIRKINLNHTISLKGVMYNNIKGENFVFPLNSLIAVSGVSGSGKSSLLKGVLLPLCEQYIKTKTINVDLVKHAENLDSIKNIAYLGQGQINSNNRSIVATYLGIFDYIRNLYASLDKSLDSSYFSFNSKVGQCEACDGAGSINENVCPVCMGSGYKNIVLPIKYNNLNIIEFLATELSIIKQVFNNDSRLSLVINTLDKLGLSYLSFDRRVDTLSGGEAQRLRLAKEMLNNEKNIKKGDFIFILDEPSKGLDSTNIQKLYNLFNFIISHNNTIIVIEHNLNIIRNADFIIDMGIGAGKNGGKNIFSGCWEDLLQCKDSITAQAINGNLDSKNIDIENKDLTAKIYDFNVSKYPYNKFLLDDKHFKIERSFADNYKIEPERNCFYFKTFNKLFEYSSKIHIKNFYFNPLIEFLYKYPKVPISIKTKILKKHKSVSNSKDDWLCRVPSNSLVEAYQKGLGIVFVVDSNGIESILSTRLISLKRKIIGTPIINAKTFSFYFNRCMYCNGNAKIDIYNKNLIVCDASKSILDTSFLKFKLNLKLKTIISKFKNEGLFDFTKSFDSLNNQERNIFLHGFREYEFLKPNGRINAKSDYVRWEGLYTYIYHNLDFIQNSQEIIDSKHQIDCPFCTKGLRKELQFYKYNDKSILDYY